MFMAAMCMAAMVMAGLVRALFVKAARAEVRGSSSLSPVPLSRAV